VAWNRRAADEGRGGNTEGVTRTSPKLKTDKAREKEGEKRLKIDLRNLLGHLSVESESGLNTV
jgi:hypothetical protein